MALLIFEGLLHFDIMSEDDDLVGAYAIPQLINNIDPHFPPSCTGRKKPQLSKAQ
jgi:hypothetical protein